MAEQPVGGIRLPITDPLSDRPPVAFGQVRQESTNIFGGLQPRLDPHEHRPEPGHQLAPDALRALGLYAEGSSRPGSCSRHTDMITGGCTRMFCPHITRSHQSGAFVQLTRRNAAAVLESELP